VLALRAAPDVSPASAPSSKVERMGRVTSGTGLVSGLDYQSIINQLMAFEKRPVDLLSTRLQNQQAVGTAYTALSVTMLSLSLSVNQFSQPSVYNARQATSSNPGVITASTTSSAVPGSYTFRSVQQAQAQRNTSAGFATATSLVGAGTVTIKRGGFVTSDTPLEALNGGAGVRLGKIRLVDRNGAAAVVDLSVARTVDDVLTAINDNGVAAITASVSGDSIVLKDHTGATTGNLSVQEVGLGNTAADLGLIGSVAAAEKVGTDVVKLGAGLKLSLLNDGLGVTRHGTLDDFRITQQDGSVIDVDLSAAQTLGDVVAAINGDSQNGGTLVASISADGDRLQLTDTSGGGGTLTVAELNGGSAARDLGLLGTEQGGGVLAGKRILAGLNSTLLSNLRGGGGIAVPGEIQLTDRSGATATVDLTEAASLSDVVAAVNGAGLGIVASINAQGHGITLTDTTGASTSNLIVADLNGGTSAADLNLVSDAATGLVQSGDLHRRYVSEGTTLSSLNGGDGIAAGSFRVTDKAGASAILTIGDSFQTIGDVVDALNAASVGITAGINSTGDGILLTDTSGGGGTLTVEDLGGGRAASDLRLRGSGDSTIDGAYTYKIELDADDTFTEAVTKLRSSGAPISVSQLNTGGLDPLKILVNSTKSGLGGRLLFDSGATNLGLAETQRAQDAVVQLSGTGAVPLLFASSTNTFSSTVQGVSLTLTGTSATPVTVTVADNPDAMVAAIEQFVSGFNSLSTALSNQTKFDVGTGTRGLLQGDGAAVQMQSSLFSLVGRQYGVGGSAIRNFAQLGVTLKGGQLSFDAVKFRNAASGDAAAVREFFSAAETGAGKVMKSVIDSYTNSGTGTLFNRIDSIDREMETLQSRIDLMNAGLERRRAKLENQFLMLEKTLSQVQAQQSSLSSLASLATQAYST